MGIEKKIFAGGGMDMDSALEFVSANDYITAYNTRVTGNTDAEEGYATNIESNELITGTRDAGINKCLGAAGFPQLRKGYAFIYNSQGFHRIIEIDYDLDVETTIFINKTNSGGVDVLPLNPSYNVTDIKLINSTFLAFTDGNMEPCYINLTRLKAGGYGVLTADDFKLIKPQPLILPIAVYNDDAGRSVNQLRGNLFRFASYFTYLDDEDSALSSHSKLVVPTNESTPSTGTDVTKSNNLIVTVNIGTDRVKTLNIAGIVNGQSDWFLIRSVTRAYVTALPNTVIDVATEVYEAYNPATNTYSFAFYNDGIYENLDVLYTDLPHDYVPLKAGSLEVLNGSILALADITEGYERPATNIELTSVLYDPAITVTQPDPSVSFRVVSTTNARISGSHKRKVTVTFAGTAKTGDVVTIKVRDIRNISLVSTYTYTVTILENNNTPAAIAKIAAQIPSASVSGSTITFKTASYYELDSAKIVLQNAGTGVSRSIHSLKTNSSYQLALFYHDKYGRYFPLATGSEYVIKTKSLAQSAGLIPKITWQIKHAPPAGAVSYQWGITKNNTHATTLYMTGKVDAAKTTADYIVFDLAPYGEFNDKNSSSILNYQYSAGDKCTFIYRVASGVTTYFNSPAVDVEVVEFEILIDKTTLAVSYFLKVRKSSAITTADLLNNNILLEIYSPRKRTTTTGGVTSLNPTLFYEFGERYDITAGAHSVTTGEITEGDCYFKTRELASGIAIGTISTHLVEDFHFSDYYQSNFTSYGRPRTYSDVQQQVRKKASIRYSDQFLNGSKINGITRFYAERIYGDMPGQTSSNYGAIGKIRQRDNYLVCIQETKVGHIPINISIIEDQEAQSQASISDTLLNYIRYSSSGNYGMGTWKSGFAERPDGTIYFCDPNNSLVIRDGNDGVKPITGKMTRFFRRTLQQADAAGLQPISYYDIPNDSLIVAIQQAGDVVTSFAFDSTNWDFKESYTILPSAITISIPPTKGVATYNNVTGKINYKANAGTSGADSFTISYLENGVVTTKKACINILPGTSAIDPFYFNDLTGQEFSTLLVSNSVLISGNTVPVAISITGGEYRKNGGAWISIAGTVVDQDEVEVRQTSSAIQATTTSAVLTVGAYSDSFDVTTEDITPVAFLFTDVTGAEVNTQYTSNTVTISGITGTVPISIAGGEYQIGTGAWTSIAGTITDGQTVKVRRTSSTSYNTSVGTTLTVGTYSDTYSILTRVANNVEVNYAMAFGSNPTTAHWNVIDRTRDGVTTSIVTIANTVSGTLPSGDVKEGDTIIVYQGAYIPFEWAPLSQVNLTMSVGAVQFYTGNVTSQTGTQNTGSYTVAPGVTSIGITSTGSSTATGYLTKSLQTVNSAVAGVLRVTIVDQSEAGLGLLNLAPIAASTTNYPFNVLGITGLLTATIYNDSSTFSIGYTLAGEGGYTVSGTIAPLGSAVHSNVTKGGLTLTIPSS